jgi:predicted GH43/DUF377 family glycosyl hydrolase
VEWVREGQVFTPGSSGEPDSQRAMRPWVLEEDGGLRMWYSGHDGTTGRILTAVHRPGAAWERLGVAIDAGFAGGSDRYGVESPCVVPTPGGYLMAYGGFDGEATRLHMATSGDGQTWTAQGTIMQRGPQDALAASHPCLVQTEAGWWLYFTGYDGVSDSRHAVVLAAVSPSGASWDRVGTVLEPGEGELAASHPCVLSIARTFYMFYASDDGGEVAIAMATSADGVSWDRHGTTLAPIAAGPDAGGVHTPCAVRLRDGSLRMWYAGLAAGDTGLAYRICSAHFPGPWSTGT